MACPPIHSISMYSIYANFLFFFAFCTTISHYFIVCIGEKNWIISRDCQVGTGCKYRWHGTGMFEYDLFCTSILRFFFSISDLITCNFQGRADRIQSALDELVKSLNERCKQYGLRAKPTTLVELPFGNFKFFIVVRISFHVLSSLFHVYNFIIWYLLY
jgi:hypothetical protein